MKYRHPALIKHRAEMNLQDRIAEKITDFAGSMAFVYLHAVWFLIWIALNVLGAPFDPFPFGLLTLIVSLEAIMLSAFIMIGQNRQGKFAAAKAEHDYRAQVLELQHNTDLTTEVHRMVTDLRELRRKEGR